LIDTVCANFVDHCCESIVACFCVCVWRYNEASAPRRG